MAINTTSRLNYEKKNAKHNLLSIIVAFLNAGLIFVFFYAVSMVSSGFDTMLTNNAEIVTNWRYTNQTTLNDDIHNEQKNVLAYSLSQLKKYDNGDYFFLNAQIPPTGTERKLVIKTYCQPVRVSINEEVVFDNLEPTAYFGQGVVADIAIPAFDESTTIDIVMRSTFQPRLQAFVVTADYFGVPITLFGLIGLIFTVLTLGISILYVIKGISHKQSLHNERSILNGFAGIVFCLPVLAEYIFSLLGIPYGVTQMQIAVAFYMAAGLLVYCRIIQKKSSIEGVYGYAIVLGAIYLAVMIVCPYQPLVITFIKFYGVYYIIACLMLIGLLNKKYFDRGASVNQLTLSSVLVFLFTYIAYWFCHMLSTPIDLTIPVVIAILQQTIVFKFLNQPEIGEIVTEMEENVDLMQFKPNDLGPLDDVLEIFLQNKLNLRHVRNVSQYVYAICRQANMTKPEAEKVAQAAFLHDIGKTMISVKIITKDDVLTTEEYERIKEHAQFGYELLSGRSEPFFKMSADIAMQHHERYDGKGYYGISGDAIDKFARITCIADVFDALTTERTYKHAWTFEESFEYIAHHSGSLFDPHYVDCFVKGYNKIYKIYSDSRNQ